MSNATDVVQVTDELLDDWATKPDGPVALRLKQRLLPVEETGIIFPPTYADIGYNIDTLSDGTRVATIDSVGSQANRLEPIFKMASTDPQTSLVPQIEIVIRKEDCGKCEACEKNGERGEAREACTQPREVSRSLLDLAHRAADAVVQSSPTLLNLVRPAFKALQQGDAGPLCAIAPTSLVFGVWDSRGDTGEKRPRLVRSIIRAWDVEPLHAAAQFNSGEASTWPGRGARFSTTIGSTRSSPSTRVESSARRPAGARPRSRLLAMARSRASSAAIEPAATDSVT